MRLYKINIILILSGSPGNKLHLLVLMITPNNLSESEGTLVAVIEDFMFLPFPLLLFRCHYWTRKQPHVHHDVINMAVFHKGDLSGTADKPY